ncbi:Choline O-acetyltransferase [Frankliniella fusca]|uniref:Choline O-acetyltransferase n=1 Tax=Frankliniella fusca TaxID=407009 RepID=A0AAE1HQV7_9NEOP|nr:Choline O-acetyltransferase [Frankliniella fusca]
MEISRKALPVERATSREKGQPFCMSQYYRLMTTVRNPGKPQDQQVTLDTSSDHIVVARHNQARDRAESRFHLVSSQHI